MEKQNMAENLCPSGDENQPDVTVDVHSDREGTARSDDGKLYKVSHLIIPIFMLETMVLLALGTFAYQLRFTELFPVTETGFYINDRSLQLPYIEDQSWKNHLSTYAACIILPVIIFIVGEIGIWLFTRNARKVIRASCVGCKIHLVPRRLIRITGTFLMGMILSSIFVDATKLMCNTHRPYFLTLCRPNVTNPSIMVTNENVCTSKDRFALREARLSFPSFHSSICGYASIFVAVYLHYVASMRGTIVLRPILISTIIGSSGLSSISRYTNYMSHWQDVIIGWLIGAIIALYLVFGLLQKFYEREDISIKNEDGLGEHTELKYPELIPWQFIPRATYHGSKGIKYIHQKNKVLKKKSKKQETSQGHSQAFQMDLHQRLENISRKASEDGLDSDMK